jgi:hypothetical protein
MRSKVSSVSSAMRAIFAADSSVVKGAIEPPPGFDRGRNERLDVRPARNIALGERCFAAGVLNQLDRFLTAVLDHVGDEYFRTLAREGERGRSLDTGGGASYERRFALKQSCHLSTSTIYRNVGDI